MQLCTDAGCAPAPDVDPTGPLALIRVVEHDGTTWTFSVEGLPETFTVRTLAADGAVLADRRRAEERAAETPMPAPTPPRAHR